MAPTMVEQFKKVAETHEKKLAQSAAQAWLLRRRVPTTRIAALFRAGLPLGTVVAQTALLVLEGWVHELRGSASKAEIVEFIQGLVHSEDPAKLPPGPLREALRKENARRIKALPCLHERLFQVSVSIRRRSE